MAGVVEMKLLAVTSIREGAGKTTLAVNLACGLARGGYPVAIVDMGRDSAARRWLEKLSGLPSGLALASWEELRQGIDERAGVAVVDLELTDPPGAEVFARADVVMAVIGFAGDMPDRDELDRIERKVQSIRQKETGIDLVVPNRVNPREWKENENKLMTLIEVWGEERIANPVPG